VVHHKLVRELDSAAVRFALNAENRDAKYGQSLPFPKSFGLRSASSKPWTCAKPPPDPHSHLQDSPKHLFCGPFGKYLFRQMRSRRQTRYEVALNLNESDEK
jgi:hypothetical protein